MVNKIKVATPTKEHMEYEDAMKNFRVATAKARLHSAGVNSSKISQQVIDKVMRISDDMDHIQQETQQKTSKIQQDAQVATQKVNQDANKKFGDMQKKYQDLINSLKEDKKEENKEDVSQIDAQQVVQAEPAKEEVREKTQEEKVAEITDIVLQHMRDSVSERVNEILSTVDKKTVEIASSPYSEGENKQDGGNAKNE